MTQRELARRSGCTKQTIHAIEAAKYGPSLALAFKVAEVFGVAIDDVWGWSMMINGVNLGLIPTLVGLLEAGFETIEFPVAMLVGAEIYEGGRDAAR